VICVRPDDDWIHRRVVAVTLRNAVRGLILVGTLGLAGGCLADTGAIQRCRQIAEASARLQCYDAIPAPAAVPAERNRDAKVEPAGPGASASTAPPADPSNADPTKRFGLENRPRPATSAVDAIESMLPGRFTGWLSNSRFRLSNGQIWEIRDGSEAAYDLHDPKVRIVRGFAGTFFMQIEGVSQTPRVRRVE
jgi:hypothetical protein